MPRHIDVLGPLPPPFGGVSVHIVRFLELVRGRGLTLRMDNGCQPTSGAFQKAMKRLEITPEWTVILQTTLSGEREQIVVSRWYLAPGLFLEAGQHEDRSLTLDIKLRRPY